MKSYFAYGPSYRRVPSSVESRSKAVGICTGIRMYDMGASEKRTERVQATILGYRPRRRIIISEGRRKLSLRPSRRSAGGPSRILLHGSKDHSYPDGKTGHSTW